LANLEVSEPAESWLDTEKTKGERYYFACIHHSCLEKRMIELFEAGKWIRGWDKSVWFQLEFFKIFGRLIENELEMWKNWIRIKIDF